MKTISKIIATIVMAVLILSMLVDKRHLISVFFTIRYDKAINQQNSPQIESKTIKEDEISKFNQTNLTTQVISTPSTKKLVTTDKVKIPVTTTVSSTQPQITPTLSTTTLAFTKQILTSAASKSATFTSVPTSQHENFTLAPTFKTVSMKPTKTKSLTTLPSSAKILKIHSAIFDSHLKSNHTNAIVIFMTAPRSILDKKLIVSCGVNNRSSTKFRINIIANYKSSQDESKDGSATIEQALLYCYEINVKNGNSNALIAFRELPKGEIVLAKSENYVVKPAPRVSSSDFSVLACVILKHTNQLLDYIMHLKRLNVTHAHFIISHYFIKNMSAIEGFTQDGYVTFEYSNTPIGILQTLECLYKFKGTYNYILPMGDNDYFIPLIDGRKKIMYYIKNRCQFESARCCQFHVMKANCTINATIEDTVSEYRIVYNTRTIEDMELTPTKPKCPVTVKPSVAYVSHVIIKDCKI